MKENILFKYMDRLKSDSETESPKNPGPIITISREYGCYAGEIAEKLQELLSKENSKNKKENWIWIDKEIVNDAAVKLETNPNHLKHFFEGETYKFLGDIVVSFSKTYTSGDVIKKTVSKVVKTYADVGNVIIVGRAGFAITQNIEKSLHIKLIAPINWRAKSLASRLSISEADAKIKINEIDKKRDSFAKMFSPSGNDSTQFHVVFNREKMTTDEIVNQILLLAKNKKLV